MIPIVTSTLNTSGLTLPNCSSASNSFAIKDLLLNYSGLNALAISSVIKTVDAPIKYTGLSTVSPSSFSGIFFSTKAFNNRHIYNTPVGGVKSVTPTSVLFNIDLNNKKYSGVNTPKAFSIISKTTNFKGSKFTGMRTPKFQSFAGDFAIIYRPKYFPVDTPKPAIQYQFWS